MKMVLVSYNEALESDVMDALSGCGMKHYTKITGVYGSGKSSGIHSGDDIWPGRNNLLLVCCLPDEANRLMSCVKSIRAQIAHEGIKAFAFMLDSVTE